MQSPFSARRLPTREQAREPAPGGAVLRIGEDVRRAVGEDEPRADRDLQLDPLVAVGVFLQGGGMRPHDAGNGVAIGDAEAGEAELAWRARPALPDARRRAGRKNWW